MSAELAKRIITALILASLLLLVLFVLPPRYAIFAFAVFAVLAAWEWAGLMRAEAAARVMFAGLTALFCWQVQAIGEHGFILFWGAAVLFWCFLAPLWLRYQWRLASNDFAAYAVGIVLIVAAWGAMTIILRSSVSTLLAILAIAWVSDIAAYFAGKAWGRRKLAPLLSPGKTWEGAIAGVVAAALAALIAGGVLQSSISGSASLIWAAVGAILAAMGILADIFESMLKRQAGIKDSSRLLPGHGGILDRIDSQLAILPMAALLMHSIGSIA